MINKIKFRFINSEKGVTLAEVIVIVVIVALFSVIVVANFPEIQEQRALSSASYALAQDLRRAEDLGLSGVKIKDSGGNPIAVKGYGLYIDVTLATKYLVYADIFDGNALHNYMYNGNFDTNFCSESTNPTTDCIVQIVDMGEINQSLFVNAINNKDDNPISGNNVSINFMPPGPIIKITNDAIPPVSYPTIKIILSNGSLTRTVLINNHGLINVQ